MNYPLPDYLPADIKELIYRKQYRSLGELSKEIGMADSALHSFWRRQTHRDYHCIKKFSDWIGLDIDDMCWLLDQDKETRKSVINKLIKTRYRSYQQCANICGISRAFIYRVIDGISFQGLKRTYKPLASALGLTLQEFDQYIPGK